MYKMSNFGQLYVLFPFFSNDFLFSFRHGQKRGGTKYILISSA